MEQDDSWNGETTGHLGNRDSPHPETERPSPKRLGKKMGLLVLMAGERAGLEHCREIGGKIR